MANKVKFENKNRQEDKQVEQPKKKLGSIFKVILILFIVLILVVAGFATGVYLKFINMEELATNWNLSNYPVVGQYFSPPKTNFEPVELEQEDPIVVSPKPIVPTVVSPLEILPEKKKVDDVELQRQAKIKQQEEAKRISKLARLYGVMKADDAVAILNKMDDETVLIILNKMDEEQVAKIMALFDANRAATISKSMLRGRSII